MKTLFGTDKHVLILLGVVGSAVLIAFPQQSAMAGRTGKGKHKPKVEITNETIVLHPAVKLSPADAKAVDDVLQKNSKTLYKIDTVENGKVTKTAGVLPEASLTAAAKSEAAAAPRGQGDKTHQVICEAPCRNNQQVPPFSTIFKSTDSAAKQRLIQELKPILEKYK
jgi:hypothetical protein